MPPLNEPIAAVATPPGRGAIAMLRISGSDLSRIADQLLGKLPPPRVASYRPVYGADHEPIDEAIVIYFAAPKSFTGEDTLEIQTHGGDVVINDVLQAAITAGARHAAPGEFSERAFLNGKIDLIQAEAVADLIESSTSLAARLAHRSLAGHFSREVKAITKKLISFHVQLEATIDFPEENITAPALADMVARSLDVYQHLSRLLQEAQRGAKLNAGLNIAIVGRPNVGKSTLLNVLAHEERAIVTNIPGTTRDVLTVDINVRGLPVRFYDTAGLREAEDPIEIEGVQRAKQAIELSDAVFFLVVDKSDELEEFINGLAIPVFKIRNKIDLDHLGTFSEKRSNGAYIQISAKHEQGIELLHEAIIDHFNLAQDRDNMILARDRHLSGLSAARDALNFDHEQHYRDAPELGAEDLRRAVRALSALTGEYTSEELLGDIFSTFCIGK